MNVAGLLVTSGICEADTSNMGAGDDGKVITERGPGGGRWKEGLRRARWAIEAARLLRAWSNLLLSQMSWNKQLGEETASEV